MRIGVCHTPPLLLTLESIAKVALVKQLFSVVCVRNGRHLQLMLPLTYPEPRTDITNQSRHSPLSLTAISESFSTQCPRKTLPIDQNGQDRRNVFTYGSG